MLEEIPALLAIEEGTGRSVDVTPAAERKINEIIRHIRALENMLLSPEEISQISEN